MCQRFFMGSDTVQQHRKGMWKVMNHVEKAHALFCQGYNCAQSVVGAFHEEMGL